MEKRKELKVGKHLTSIGDLENWEVEKIFEYAEEFLERGGNGELKGRVVINVFFENSTRTRSSFEMAAKKLGAEVINLDVERSSTSKGETLFDTAANLDAMGPDAIVVRHRWAGVPELLSKYLRHSVIINGGDGAHQHPTQALLDLFTLRRKWGDVKGKKIAIVGDIRNSRVANSDIELLTRFGVEVTLVGPPQFLPQLPLPKSYKLEEVLDKVDGVIALRTQTERHHSPTFASLHDFAVLYQINGEKLKGRSIVILHPGPVNRNVELSDEVVEGENSLILEQVKNGVAVRMGILKYLLKG